MPPPKPTTTTANHLRKSLTHQPNVSRLADKCTTHHHLTQLHAHMITTSRINTDNYAASRLLLSTISLSNTVSYAIKLFNHFPLQPNSFMYNTIIRALVEGPDPEKGLTLYKGMRRLEAMQPGKHTFTFVLKGCARMRWLMGCREVHCEVVKWGFGWDEYVGNGLVRGYVEAGVVGEARMVFDEMAERVRGAMVWTSMVCGYVKGGEEKEGLVLFERMAREDGVEPSGAMLASVLSACAKEGCLGLGDRIYGFLRGKGVELGVILGTALVDMYAKNGAVAKARIVFESMRERNIATWNAMIHGFAVHGHGEEALVVFYELKKDEVIKPNHITFVGVLSACGHEGYLELGHDIFYLMKEVYNVEPRIEHYGCMVDILGRGGKLEEAEELIRGMPWKADIVIWGTLLSACKSSRNIEVAKRVVEEILRLDPSNHGVHVVLSNMYAEAGSWEHVSSRRETMKTGNLKKVPGWSLVENGG